jgi:hypothetical protein
VAVFEEPVEIAAVAGDVKTIHRIFEIHWLVPTATSPDQVCQEVCEEHFSIIV